MAITNNLVELLGGSIDVKSRLGEGTVFTVKLPFDLPEDSEEYHVRELETLRVLVVDDEEYDRIHANILLKRLGIAAQFAKSGREAIKAVLEAQEAGTGYDVCIVDWRMPNMDGIEVTRKIRETAGSDVLMIVLSAFDWSEIDEEGRRAGVNAFIAKPLLESPLRNVLESVLGADISSKEPEAAQSNCTGSRLLLAEDNALNMEIAVELLQMAGAESDCAVNGKEAVEKFEDSPAGYYDAILMDVQMPVMDGYTATRKIRAGGHPDAKTIPIIAMTANIFSEDIDAAYAAGMNGHMAKPIDAKTLYQTIAGVLKL